MWQHCHRSSHRRTQSLRLSGLGQGIYSTLEVQSTGELESLLLGAVVGLGEEVSGTLQGVLDVVQEEPLAHASLGGRCRGGFAVGELVDLSQGSLADRNTQLMSRLGELSQDLCGSIVTGLHTGGHSLSGCQVWDQLIYGTLKVQSGGELESLLLGAVEGLGEEVAGTLQGVLDVLEEEPLADISLGGRCRGGGAVGQLVDLG